MRLSFELFEESFSDEEKSNTPSSSAEWGASRGRSSCFAFRIGWGAV
jgi:hypothetical protein